MRIKDDSRLRIALQGQSLLDIKQNKFGISVPYTLNIQFISRKSTDESSIAFAEFELVIKFDLSATRGRLASIVPRGLDDVEVRLAHLRAVLGGREGMRHSGRRREDRRKRRDLSMDRSRAGTFAFFYYAPSADGGYDLDELVFLLGVSEMPTIVNRSIKLPEDADVKDTLTYLVKYLGVKPRVCGFTQICRKWAV